ncbi:hypothetical protein KUTeg_001568 [Tegillarca granosa]|uniref:G-protein coupled receptors family 1 profile domain-containing protein n=1 Tax=Tegillarca granosa TaxID=220873 RepID=A0ABQ9FTB5_TEGGR|nr:hypothetical protein KUTeg_001568 [Tegillarca granosa]
MTTLLFENRSSIFSDGLFLGNNSNSSDSGNISTSGGNHGRDETLANFEIFVSGLILYLAVFGNAVALLVLRWKRTKLSRMQLFIVHLCLADIFVALFNVLPQMIWDITYRFQGNNFLCKIVKYFQLVAMYSSTYVLVMTALDRYISICYPLTSQTWTSRRVHIMVALAWGLSLVLSVPQLVLFSMQEVSPGSNVYDCWETMSVGPHWHLQLYVTWIFSSVYAIPFLILTFAYTRICYVVWMSVGSREGSCKNKRIANGRSLKISFKKANTFRDNHHHSPRLVKNPRAHSKGVSKSKIKTIKLTLMVVLCFVICWGPFFVTMMWSAFDFNMPFNSTVSVIFLLMASLNSCTNPWIYLAFSVKPCGKKRRSTEYRTSMDSESRTRTVMLDRSMSVRHPENEENGLLESESKF